MINKKKFDIFASKPLYILLLKFNVAWWPNFWKTPMHLAKEFKKNGTIRKEILESGSRIRWANLKKDDSAHIAELLSLHFFMPNSTRKISTVIKFDLFKTYHFQAI